jgi:hypothetical protein
METFFDVEDGEVENLAPQVCNSTEFRPASLAAMREHVIVG